MVKANNCNGFEVWARSAQLVCLRPPFRPDTSWSTMPTSLPLAQQIFLDDAPNEYLCGFQNIKERGVCALCVPKIVSSNELFTV